MTIKCASFSFSAARLFSNVFLINNPVLRIRDICPGSWILIFIHPRSLIPEPTKPTKEKGENMLLFYHFLYPQISQNWTLLCFIFKENNLSQFTELKYFLPKKLSLSSQKYGLGIRDQGPETRDPRSRIRKKPILDPGSRIQGSRRHRIPDRIRNTAIIYNFFKL